MIRILGVICGAAIAIGLLTWFVGVPQFTAERGSVPEEPFAIVSLPAATPPEPIADEPIADELMANELVADKAVADEVTAGTPVQSPQPGLVPTDSDAVAVAIADTPATASGAPEAPPPVDVPPVGVSTADSLMPDVQFYSFWSPFRSEIAANGFVAELQRVTGLDYQVVKVKTGVYEVAFEYTDDEDRERYLATISAATGLDLPGTP